MALAAHGPQTHPELCRCPLHVHQSAARSLAYRRLALAIALSHTPLLRRPVRSRPTR